MRNYAALPWDYLTEMEELSDAEFGRLARALLQYSMTGQPMALSGNERFFSRRVMAQEDRFQASYKAKAQNGSLGGRPAQNSTETKANQTKLNETEINLTKPNKTKANQTKPKSETKTNTETKNILNASRSCAEPRDAASAPNPAAPPPPPPGSVERTEEPEKPAYQLLLNDGTFFPITAAQVARWKELYPAVDVDQSVRSAIGWCENNPTRRKTAKGANRFLNNWLAKDQNGGGTRWNQRSGTDTGQSHFLSQFSPAELAKYQRELDRMDGGGGDARDCGADQNYLGFLRGGVAPELPGAE